MDGQGAHLHRCGMPKFSANLTMMFNEFEFLDRFEAASRAGFEGVEYVGPYAYPAREIADRLKRYGLSQALFNLPAGDWAAGERGIAILPDRVDEFRDGLETAVTYAKALSCPRINCLAGLTPAGADPKVLEDTLVKNLALAADRLGREGIQLVLEPINPIDIPGFFLNTSRQALRIMDRVGSPNLFLQYDIYHMQIVEGDLARSIERNLGRIGHIQIADNPGRHEPGTGEINIDFLMGYLDRLGYDGWVGAEYRPAITTEEGLGWFQKYRPSKPHGAA
jgi:hydroxypyruvate isomerase